MTYLATLAWLALWGGALAWALPRVLRERP